MKKPTLSSAKKKTWATLSLWIRTKDSKDGYCTCVTCGWTGPISTMQAGHFIRKARGTAAYFEENNIKVQCQHCNENLGGNEDQYYSYMLQTYGQSEVDRLEFMSKTIVRYRVHDYEKIESLYKEKLKKFNEAN